MMDYYHRQQAELRKQEAIGRMLLAFIVAAICLVLGLVFGIFVERSSSTQCLDQQAPAIVIER